jgi:alkanesulfonate monooxygenase SsuD/methylene tetrahydromethanopterin reductase-like flavin-dependent oxidoreductase (luciferase family)
MDLGLYLCAQHPPRRDPAAVVRELAEQVRLAGGLGFSTVMVGHHYLSSPYWTMQNVPLLARLSVEAGEIRMATGILLLPLLNPLEVAEEVATLSAICDGRVVAGFGLGYRRVEDAAFGLDGNRGEVFERKLEVVRRLLGGEEVTARGTGYELEGARLTMPPVPQPPVWIAANSDAAVERAARLGDAWLINPHTKLSELVRQTGRFQAARREAGLPMPDEVPAFREVAIGGSDEEAVRRARPFLVEKYATYMDWGQGEVLPKGDRLDAEWERLAAEDRFIVGSPQTCLRQALRHRDELGVTELICRVQWPGMPQDDALQAIELLGRGVLPALRESEGASALG